jgi:ubiquinone/menaquinone biosynthesis C-methylase UbiE
MANVSDSNPLKEQVRAFWNEQSCDTQVATSEKFSGAYFDEIESFRYFDQPYIHSFAQFSRYHGKRVLEVGFGAGTDFIQWLRSGAIASGIDLTQEALDNLSHRIDVYKLPRPEKIMVADAENLPFESNSFDLGYSFGVLHHSPNTERAVSELIRVTRPGGEIKIMLYNRRCIYVFNNWVKYAFLRGRPWKSMAWVMWNHFESIGTKGYTRTELKKWFAALPLQSIHIHTEITAADVLSSSAFPPLNEIYRGLLRLSGQKYGWHPAHYVERGAAARRQHGRESAGGRVLITGNPFGHYHCITARKLNE